MVKRSCFNTLWTFLIFAGLSCSSRYIYGMDFNFILPILLFPFVLIVIIIWVTTVADWLVEF